MARKDPNSLPVYQAPQFNLWCSPMGNSTVSIVHRWRKRQVSKVPCTFSGRQPLFFLGFFYPVWFHQTAGNQIPILKMLLHILKRTWSCQQKHSELHSLLKARKWKPVASLPHPAPSNPHHKPQKAASTDSGKERLQKNVSIANSAGCRVKRSG